MSQLNVSVQVTEPLLIRLEFSDGDSLHRQFAQMCHFCDGTAINLRNFIDFLGALVVVHSSPQEFHKLIVQSSQNRNNSSVGLRRKHQEEFAFRCVSALDFPTLMVMMVGRFPGPATRSPSTGERA